MPPLAVQMTVSSWVFADEEARNIFGTGVPEVFVAAKTVCNNCKTGGAGVKRFVSGTSQVAAALPFWARALFEEFCDTSDGRKDPVALLQRSFVDLLQPLSARVFWVSLMNFPS